MEVCKFHSIYDSFKHGKAKAKEWTQRFDESQSIIKAFEDNFVELAPDSFLFTKEVHRLSQVLGSTVSSPEAPSQITITGPQRIGKSTALRSIAKDLNSNIKENYAIYKKYDDTFWSWWEEADFGSTQIFFFDNIYSIWDLLTIQSYNDLLERSKFERIIIVTVLNNIERHWLHLSEKNTKLNVFNSDIFEFQYKRCSLNEIENIIKKRLEVIGKAEFFSNDVLKTVSILSLGLPGLALWFMRHIISQQERQEKPQGITIPFVHRIAEYIGFKPALKVIIEHNLQYTQQTDQYMQKKFWPILHPLKELSYNNSSSLLQSLEKSKIITKSWLPILEDMLLLNQREGAIKRSELQERTGVKESSLTYQCQRLIKEKILTYNKDGREVYYQLGSPVKEALELTLFN